MPLSPYLVRQSAQLRKAFGERAPIMSQSESAPLGTAPAQRKPLDPNRLNVAGEEHDKSDLRRDQERAFAQKRLGTQNYWTEGEFVNAQTGEPADPLALRFLHIAQFGLAGMQPAATITRETHLNDLHYGETGTIKVVSDALELFYAADFVEYAGAMPGGPILRQLALALQLSHREALQACTTIANTVAGITRAATTDGTIDLTAVEVQVDQSEELQSALDTLIEKCASISRHLAAINQGFKLVGRNLREERSSHMHSAANGRAGEHGLWKIGDEHVNDLDKLKDRRYNLLTKQEFNKELEYASASVWGKISSTVSGWFV